MNGLKFSLLVVIFVKRNKMSQDSATYLETFNAFEQLTVDYPQHAAAATQSEFDEELNTRQKDHQCRIALKRQEAENQRELEELEADIKRQATITKLKIAQDQHSFMKEHMQQLHELEMKKIELEEASNKQEHIIASRRASVSVVAAANMVGRGVKPTPTHPNRVGIILQQKILTEELDALLSALKQFCSENPDYASKPDKNAIVCAYEQRISELSSEKPKQSILSASASASANIGVVGQAAKPQSLPSRVDAKPHQAPAPKTYSLKEVEALGEKGQKLRREHGIIAGKIAECLRKNKDPFELGLQLSAQDALIEANDKEFANATANLGRQ